jgi:hypothetical protein
MGEPTVQLSYKAHKQHHFDGTFCNKVVKKVGGPDPPVPPESYAYGCVSLKLTLSWHYDMNYWQIYKYGTCVKTFSTDVFYKAETGF